MKEKLTQSILSLLQTKQNTKLVHVDVPLASVTRWVASLYAILSEIEKLGVSPPDVLREMHRSLVAPESSHLADPGMFRRVPLPPGLTNDHKAMDYTVSLITAINRDMRNSAGHPLTHYIQANNFSGIVSNILTDGLDKFSPYKHNNDQQYPDLRNDSGTGLEMKAANRAGKGGESHNGHGGWHLVACFQLDEPTGNIRFVHIEIAELVSFQDDTEGDWKYCGSKRNEEGSQRTETYYTTNRGTWKLRDGSAYLDTTCVDISRWRRRGNEIPNHSPFAGRVASSRKERNSGKR